jgi:LysM repeat protein
VTDETPKKSSGHRPPDAVGTPPASGDAPPGGRDDPDAALDRLASMGAGKKARLQPLPPTPAVATYDAPPSDPPSQPMGSAQRTPRARPRPAGAPSSSGHVARIAAPVVFLIAVIALVGIVVQSGVMTGSTEPTPTPSVKATKSTSVTKKYVVKSGDSWSSIAARFNTSVADLQALNPDLSTTTLTVGIRIVVPRQ